MEKIVEGEAYFLDKGHIPYVVISEKESLITLMPADKYFQGKPLDFNTHQINRHKNNLARLCVFKIKPYGKNEKGFVLHHSWGQIHQLDNGLYKIYALSADRVISSPSTGALTKENIDQTE